MSKTADFPPSGVSKTTGWLQIQMPSVTVLRSCLEANTERWPLATSPPAGSEPAHRGGAQVPDPSVQSQRGGWSVLPAALQFR